MAVVRRISFTEFKEIVVDLQPNQIYSDYQVIPPISPSTTFSQGFAVTNPGREPERRTFSNFQLDEWGFFVNGRRITQDDSQDTNLDGIPDYLSIDLDDNGVIDGNDGFGSQDFVGVLKKSFLLGKIRYIDYYDEIKTVEEIYQDVANGVPINSFFSEIEGWVIIAESKPSFYYEQCGTSYGSNFYFGRVPVSINYFDLDDIWVNEGVNGVWPLVWGEGQNPLEVIGEINVRNTLMTGPSRNGFEWNFGPDLEEMPQNLEMKYIQQYMPFVINEQGRALFPNLTRNPQNIATIQTTIRPVNLHFASRFDIDPNDTRFLNQTGVSTKPFNPDYYDLFPEIPDVIQFKDGAKKRWGRPRHAIKRGFTISGIKYQGKCIPIPGEQQDEEPVTQSQKRKLVSIKDVLSGKVVMDGTNYIRGVVTAHFTYPIMSATLQDIADIYYAYSDQSKLGVSFLPTYFGTYQNGRVTFDENSVNDPLTFAREMRSVIYVQDDTAGMELMGTDFYSTEGIEFQTSPSQITIDSVVKKYTDEIFNKPKSIDEQLEKTVLPLLPEDMRTGGSLFDQAATSTAALENLASSIPIKEYWEFDTGYLPSRYHFKVGDFIEVYNLNVVKRSYAPRTCKIVNNDYKIIPNNTDDIMSFLESNGYIKDVNIEQLSYGPKLEAINPTGNVWQTYDYSDENSVHATENCLIRIKNVAFANVDTLTTGQSLLLKQTPLTVYSNDQNPFILPENTNAIVEEFDDYGHRFEPGKKYVIFDASDFSGTNTVNRPKMYLYNAPSTEMSKYLFHLPGKNTNLSQEYLDWLKFKRQFDPPASKYDDYQWPLTIIGIQKFALQNDSLKDYSYMIMPRSMVDLGITLNNYDILREIRLDKFTTPPSDPKGGGTGTGSGTGPSVGTGTGTGPTGGNVGSSTGAKISTCFQKGTRVMTPDGFKNVEDINVGDLVITFDDDINLHQRPVVRKYVHEKEETSDIYRYTFSNGTILNVTENHPFLTEKMKFVHIGNLNIGESVITKDKTYVQILSKEFIKNDTVYNIEVDEYNAYIVENICVHNLTKRSPILERSGEDDIGFDGPVTPVGP